MPRGGHGRVGPAAFDAARRTLHGTKTRRRHREKGAIGEPMITCDPPPHLTAQQRRIWKYYAPLLVAERRLPLKARDTLAKYVVALDMIAKLNRKIRSVLRKGNRHPLLGELRSWIALTRLYESDLLLNPAASIRAPQPDRPDDTTDDEDELDAILN